MKKLLIATTSTLALSMAAMSAHAQTTALDANAKAEAETNCTVASPCENDGEKLVGGTAGAGVGAVAGAAIGGPVGAVIGGFAGAIIGAEAAVPDTVVEYVVANPVEPVVLDAEVREGVIIPETVQIQQVPDNPEYGYVYVDGRPVIVKYDARKVVYSPGYVVPDTVVTYVQKNPIDAVNVDVTLGATLPTDIEIIPVPDTPAYGYVYTDGGPVLVQSKTRTVVWVAG
ncbi:DUF1236 domain-containing protein [Oricola cellulosilytica]|uniref:DUF1236 domain-containing protein n=1 Tax=Oricola cellulosilytica TaxID=1429082 RepID=A0A4R0PE98_9HYPH|nr:DUF1236 domain-containing protein [Oricola cellulosilytica]TCD16117.1 DUF1236 domain-containing protein [Oricola cellulosilytica]